MKKNILTLVIAFMLSLSLFSLPLFADDIAENEDLAVFQMLERIETIVYGAPQSGGLLPRLSTAERNVFGRELPGSLTERQTAILNFLEKETATQPSLLFKLAVTEWAVTRKTNPTLPLSQRVESLESITEGEASSGALSARIEKLIAKTLPEGILATTTSLPAGTIVKCSLSRTLSVRNIKTDDKIVLALIEDIVVNGQLVAPKGSRVLAHISKVRPPRSFGRASEIEIGFDTLEALGPNFVAVQVGDSAQKAMEADAAVFGAAGASLTGAVLLGPLGLATGFLVRGSDKQIKEGTIFYVETGAEINVSTYKVPEQISSIVTSGDIVAPQGSTPVNP